MSRKTSIFLTIIALSLAFLIFTFIVGLLRKQSAAKLLSDKYGFLWHEKNQLNRRQKDVVEKIYSGEMKRDKVEIVIAAYNENLEWTRMYHNIVTAYVKCEKEVSNLAKNMPSMTVIPLPNLGRETHTYLYHIVNRYDSLADLTVFTQGAAPTQGYKGHRDGGGHMYCNSTLHDYVTAEDGLFIFNEVMRLKDSVHSVRKGYINTKECVYRPPGSRVPPCYDPRDFDFRLIPRVDHPFTLTVIGDSCRKEKSKTCSPKLFWDEYIRLPYPSHDLIWYAQGAVFSATKEQIRRRPRSDYEAILKEASKGEDTSTGFFMEYFWYYLTRSEYHACHIDVEGANSLALFGGNDPLSALPIDQLSAILKKGSKTLRWDRFMGLSSTLKQEDKKKM